MTVALPRQRTAEHPARPERERRPASFRVILPRPGDLAIETPGDRLVTVLGFTGRLATVRDADGRTYGVTLAAIRPATEADAR